MSYLITIAANVIGTAAVLYAAFNSSMTGLIVASVCGLVCIVVNVVSYLTQTAVSDD